MGGRMPAPPAKEIYGDEDGTFWFKVAGWSEIEARRAAAEWAGIPTRRAKATVVHGVERQASHGGWWFEKGAGGEAFYEVEAFDE